MAQDQGERIDRERQRARGTPLSAGAGPNDLWCADFKAEFKLGNGRYCYPLTVTDHASRFLLLCEALDSLLRGLGDLMTQVAGFMIAAELAQRCLVQLKEGLLFDFRDVASGGPAFAAVTLGASDVCPFRRPLVEPVELILCAVRCGADSH